MSRPMLNPIHDSAPQWATPEAPKELRGIQLWHALGFGPQLQNADEHKRPAQRVDGAVRLLDRWTTQPLASEDDNRRQHREKLNPSLRLGAISGAPPETAEFGVIDLDGEDEDFMQRAKRAVELDLRSKLCWRTRDGTKGQMTIIRLVDGVGSSKKISAKDTRLRPVDQKGNGYEILLSGTQVVLDGAIFDKYAGNELRRYRWLDGYPLASELPEVGPDRLAEIVDDLREVALSCGWRIDAEKRAPTIATRAARGFTKRVKAPALPRESLSRRQYLNQLALQKIPDWAEAAFPHGRADGNGGWRVSPDATGRSCEEDLSIHPTGIQDWGQEQEERVGYTPITLIQAFFDIDERGDLVGAQEWDGDKPLGTVTEEQAVAWLCGRLGVDWEAEVAKDVELTDQAARELAETPLAAADLKMMAKFGGGDAEGASFHEAGDFSENALATRFIDAHAESVRHVVASRWLEWGEGRWRPDEKLHLLTLARQFCRSAAMQMKARNQVQNGKTIASILNLARSDPRIVVTADELDADPWLLNTPGGTVELRTGQMREHRREDLITKATAVAPGGDCPRWLAFIDRVTGQDQSLAAFIQRALGYALTGSIREECLFFLHGRGGNGKSVLLNTVASILEDYHRAAPIEAFTESRTDRHPTELAGLRGARLVTAIETEEGRRWNEARIKALTGGDRIAARFMRQDFFEYTPQFKLLIGGNHRPSLRTVDEAIRRRVNLVPFTVTIPPEERDLGLKEKLKAEWPGILQWMIEGCVAWQRDGLDPPDAVREATREYLAAEDAISLWLETCCVISPHAQVGSTALFQSWAAWADAAREPVGTQKLFSEKLEARFKKQKMEKGMYFIGLTVGEEADPW
jgi:putative DNA primase/helicase